jgi:prepilin-type N-terminal cleavage/methylation domain-containing protein
MKRGRRSGFTLAELMVAMVVGIMVLAGSIIIFTQVRTGWRATAIDLQLMSESRLIRERMLRSLGAGGTFGLREANWSSLAITNMDTNHSRISFLDGASNSCYITETNFAGRAWNVVGGVGGQIQVLLPNAPYNTYADQLFITTGANKSVYLDMRLGAIDSLGKTNFYNQYISVRLINP